MAFSSEHATVLGFQFEPERKQPQKPEYEDDAETTMIQLPAEARLDRAVTEWCQCQNCKAMPTEKECLCCHEVDEIKYFHLNGTLLILVSQKSSPALIAFRISENYV